MDSLTIETDRVQVDVFPEDDALHLFAASAEEMHGAPARLTRSEVIALRDKLSEWIGDAKCGCCGAPATQGFGTDLQCCDFCSEGCRAPGPVDRNWYHGVIAPHFAPSDYAQSFLRRKK